MVTITNIHFTYPGISIIIENRRDVKKKEKRMKTSKDLTIGNPAAVLWKFCLPMFGSILFQQMYNLADSFVAGKLISEDALAAVGNSYEITLIFIAFSFGCNIGCSVIVSRLFGARRLRDMKTAVSTALVSGAALCVLLMTAGMLFCDSLLQIIHTPDNIRGDSAAYLRIYIMSLPFILFYNLATGIFSALGDSRTPFFFLAASSTANIGMDILFAAKFRMGVPGLAWATLICQGISCVLALLVIFSRFSRITTEERAPLFSWALLREICQVAVPSILQQSFISVGNILLQGIINGFGSGVIAGYSAGVKLNNLVITSFTTIGNGVSNYTAQNLGAQKPQRIPTGHRAALRIIWLLAFPITVLYFFGSTGLVRFFLPPGAPDGDALKTGVLFLRIVSPFYCVAALKLVSDGVLRGAGMMRLFMTATFTDLILRVVLAFLLSGPFGSAGIWMAWPVGWVTATVLSLRFYRNGNWSPPHTPVFPLGKCTLNQGDATYSD